MLFMDVFFRVISSFFYIDINVDCILILMYLNINIQDFILMLIQMYKLIGSIYNVFCAFYIPN